MYQVMRVGCRVLRARHESAACPVHSPANNLKIGHWRLHSWSSCNTTYRLNKKYQKYEPAICALCNILAETAVSKANTKRTNGHLTLSGTKEVDTFEEVEVTHTSRF